MELRHIRYFLAVADEENFTRAAARVGIGQPPLSQQIRDLEAEVGTPLFRRLPHGAELTDAGRAFLLQIGRVPEQVAGAVRAAQRAGRGETGVLKVGFTGSAAMNPVVAKTIRAFRHRYSEVDLSLTESNSTTLTAGLRDGSVDVAFLRPEPERTLADMRIVPFADEAMVVALPTGHPALDRDGSPAIALALLRDEAFILTPRAIGPSLFDAAIGACEAAGFTPRLGQPAPQIASVLSLVAAAEGVSMVPASMRQLALEGVVYREIVDLHPVVTLALAHRREDHGTIVRNFMAVALAGLS